MLGRDDLMRYWLSLSARDFEEFIALPDVKGAGMADNLLIHGSVYATIWGGSAVFGTTVVTIMTGGIALPWLVGSAIFAGSAWKTFGNTTDRANYKNSLAKSVVDQKTEAIKALPQVKQIIADLPQLPENQAE